MKAANKWLEEESNCVTVTMEDIDDALDKVSSQEKALVFLLIPSELLWMIIVVINLKLEE